MHPVFHLSNYLPEAIKQKYKSSNHPLLQRIENSRLSQKADDRYEPLTADYDAASGAPSHIVCIVVDGLRHDAITKNIAPSLTSQSPMNAITAAPWTFPSVTSILTGKYPHQHGAMRNADGLHRPSHPVPQQMSKSHTTLPQALAAAGYETYGGFGFITPFWALRGRFQTHKLYRHAVRADEILDDHLSWLSKHRTSSTFSYIHLNDAHEPIDPPQAYHERHEVDADIDVSDWDSYEPETESEVRRFKTHRKRIYKAAVDYVTDCIKSYQREVENEFDDILFVVTADHGKGFWECSTVDEEHFDDTRGYYCVGHGGTPYESITRVPLVIESDQVTHQSTPVSLVDVCPTILDIVGLEGALACSGYSLSSSIPDTRVPIVEGVRYGYEKKAVYHDDWKLIVSRGDDATVGFSLPSETVQSIPDDAANRLHAAVPRWLGEGDQSDDRTPESVAKRLEELGYK